MVVACRFGLRPRWIVETRIGLWADCQWGRDPRQKAQTPTEEVIRIWYSIVNDLTASACISKMAF